MNAQDVGPIEQQASRNAAAGWGWCFVHPVQVLELARAVRERDEARARLAEIKVILRDRVLPEWAEHCRDAEREDLERAIQLCENP